ncbi:MAG: HEAT repeat domain-containing protein, partial [Desulfovibrio sp.]|nr:HEAT repeat domain-containing protein [Desulfovibrio sp.]
MNENLQSSPDEILAKLKSDDSSEIRDAAFSAGDLNVREAIPQLCALVSSNNIGIQEAAEYALRKIRGTEVIEHLLPLLQSEEVAVRNVAMDILREIGPDNIESMRPYLRGEDSDLRIFVSDILGHCHHHKAADLLCEALLKDPEVNVRYQAAISLGNLAYPESVQALSQAMHDEEWVQFAVVEALAKIKDYSAITALMQLLSQSSPLVSSAIVDALGDLGDIKIVPMLLNALEKVNDALRNKIIKSVVKILSGSSLALLPNKFKTNLNSYLRSALTDSDEEVQEAALTGLKSIGTAEASQSVFDLTLTLNPETQSELYTLALETLAQLGYSNALKTALRSNNEKEIFVVMETLRFINDRAPLSDLKNAFWRINPELRRTAIQLIAKIADCQDLPFFLSVLDECEDAEIINRKFEYSQINSVVFEGSIKRDIRILITKKGRSVLVNGKKVSKLSDLAKCVNVLLFEPKDVMLFRGSPKERR